MRTPQVPTDFDFQQLAKRWPAPCVARTDKALMAFGGGLLPAASTFRNLDSKGLGPSGKFRVGKVVAYPVTDLIAWIEKRARG